MVHWLIAVATLSEDPGSIPRTSLSAHIKLTSANNALVFLDHSKAMGKRAFLLVTSLSAADTMLIMEHQAGTATED